MANATGPAHTFLETVSESIGDMVREGAAFLADFLRRIASNLAGIAAPLAMSLGLASAGCQSEAVETTAPPPPAPKVVAASVPDAAPVADKEPEPIGKFNITFYYVAGEQEVDARAAAKAAKLASITSSATPANDNQGPDAVTELAAVVVPEMVSVYEGGTCKPIAQVSKEFAAQMALQGTGLLKDGRVVNVWGHCNCERSPCFKVTSAKWGTAGTGRPLQPFRTVAVDPKVVKLGSLLYVPLLDGRTMPGRSPWGGFVHDGCVVADDTGGGINGHQIDLFVGRKGYYLGVSGSGGSHSWARKVPVYDGSKRCERKGRQVTRRAGAI